MTDTTTIPTADLRYKWQDCEEDYLKSRLHERYITDPLYREGLFNGGNKTLPLLFLDIRANGIRDPLNVYQDDDAYRIIRGNQRLAIARALGIEQLKCIVHASKHAT